MFNCKFLQECMVAHSLLLLGWAPSKLQLGNWKDKSNNSIFVFKHHFRSYMRYPASQSVLMKRFWNFTSSTTFVYIHSCIFLSWRARRARWIIIWCNNGAGWCAEWCRSELLNRSDAQEQKPPICTDHQICSGNDRFMVLMLQYICCNTSLQPWGKHKNTGPCTKHILHKKSL